MGPHDSDVPDYLGRARHVAQCCCFSLTLGAINRRPPRNRLVVFECVKKCESAPEERARTKTRKPTGLGEMFLYRAESQSKCNFSCFLHHVLVRWRTAKISAKTPVLPVLEVSSPALFSAVLRKRWRMVQRSPHLIREGHHRQACRCIPRDRGGGGCIIESKVERGLLIDLFLRFRL